MVSLLFVVVSTCKRHVEERDSLKYEMNIFLPSFVEFALEIKNIRLDSYLALFNVFFCSRDEYTR